MSKSIMILHYYATPATRWLKELAPLLHPIKTIVIHSLRVSYIYLLRVLIGSLYTYCLCPYDWLEWIAWFWFYTPLKTAQVCLVMVWRHLLADFVSVWIILSLLRLFQFCSRDTVRVSSRFVHIVWWSSSIRYEYFQVSPSCFLLIIFQP